MKGHRNLLTGVLTAAALMLISAGTAKGQSCEFCGDYFSSETIHTSTITWSYSISNCDFELNCCGPKPAEAQGDVRVYGFGVFHRCQDLNCAPVVPPCNGYDQDSGSDSSSNLCDPQDYYVSLSLGAATCEGSAGIEYYLEACDGTKTATQTGRHRTAAYYDTCGQCVWRTDNVVYANPVGNGFVVLRICPGQTLSYTHTVQFGVTFSGFNHGGFYIPSGTTRIRAIHQETYYTGPTSTPGSSDVAKQGVVAFLSDGSTLRLGEFSTSGFSFSHTSTAADLSGSLSDNYANNGSSSVDRCVREKTLDFDTFGDSNQDGVIRWADRGMVLGSIGATIGHWGYSAITDLDLDGDVDSADLSYYDSAFPMCAADVDDGSGTGTPDGGVTSDDMTYYLEIFELGAMPADLDDGTGSGLPDGGVTLDDLLYFLDRFEIGC